MKIPESNIRNMLKAIGNGNHVLNETVQIYSNSKTKCPDCKFDPIRKESTDRNCPTCEGVGYIITEVFQTIPASVEQSEDFRYDYTKAGKYVDGNIFLTIDIEEINTVLNVDEKYDLDDYNQMKAFIESFDYVVWKGAKFKTESFEPGYLQGYLYEIGISLALME
ncbi:MULTISPECIES: hypothetical protein [Paenibacillus]|uniref:hypothetical protein n=1 Tax=Paenibacillus TaxID=44249 RepID=UPI000F52AD61|nr:hypothetical protein [Paenibacillus xylanexedens]